MNTKIIKFDINKNLYNTLIAKQGDTKSRFLLFNLLDGSIPFSLENRSVRVYAVKPDRTEVFNDLIITDAAKGYCILELTTQILAVAGTVKLELMVIEEDKKLTSSIFYMDVKASINSEKAVVSTNEFGALLTALSSLNEYDNYKKEIAAARDGEANLLTKVKKIDEQLDTNAYNLTYLITKSKTISEIKTLVSNGGKFKFAKGEFNITETLVINSNTEIDCNKSTKLTAQGIDVVMEIEGENISIYNININGLGNASCGINIKSGSKNIKVNGVTIVDIKGDNTPAYGIFFSGRRCKNIAIENCTIENITSIGNGTIGKRDAGWSKGICMDIYGLSDQTPITTEVTTIVKIKNNIIKNIQDNEDGDGIYVDGFRPYIDVDLEIEGNSFFNCAKRAIKILPSKNVRIHDNYIYTDSDTPMNSFISCYANGFSIYDNKCIANNNYVGTAVDFGFESDLYGDTLCEGIGIYNNYFDLGDNINSNQAILKNDAKNNFNDISIYDNKFFNAKVGIRFYDDASKTGTINSLIIGRNLFFKTNGSAIILNTYMEKCFIERNKFLGEFTSNAVNITQRSGTKNKVIKVTDNYFVESPNSSLKIDGVENAIINDNVGDNLSIYVLNYDDVKRRNNLNLTTHSYLEAKLTYKSISTSEAGMNITLSANDFENNAVVKYNLASGTVTLSSITGGNDGQVLTIATNLMGSNVVLQLLETNNNYKLNGTCNLSDGATITLVKIGSKWHEISRSN